MEEIKLDVQIRKEVGSREIKPLRKEDFVPGIVYGSKKAPTPIKIDRSAYEKLTRGQHGQSALFHLNVMEGDKKLRDYSAIVREVQHHPVYDSLVHIDFQRISLTEEIEVKVPVISKGDAVGVKKQGGSIDQPLHELEVICLPTNIPKQITVDVTNLSIGDAIHVKDITLPVGVRTKHDRESIVLSIVPPMKEDVEKPEGQLTEPELIREKKEKTEEDAGGEAPAEKAEKAPEKKEKKEEKK